MTTHKLSRWRIAKKVFGALVLLSVPALALALFSGSANALLTGPVGEFRVIDAAPPASAQTPVARAAAPADEPTEVEFKSWEKTSNTSRFK